MQQGNEDAETLRRVDALGDGQLSQALREALARRSDAARVEAMNDDERAAWDASENARLDAWIPDLSRPLNEAEGASLNTFYRDEAAVRLVVPPFALLQLNTDVRRKVLAFLLCTSQDHALRAVAASRVPERPDAIKHETTRSLLYSPPLSGNEIAVFSNRGGSSTVLRGAAPHSTAALVDTLFHHTAALRVVCTELRIDAVALSSAANSEATPRSWLANLYCRRDTALDDETVVCELRARALSGRRANTVRDLFLRKDACSRFTPPEHGEDIIAANATETKLTTDAFTALGEVEFAGDVKPTLYDEGSGIFRKSSYTIVPISAKFQAGGEKRDCFIEGHCCRGAMDSVELNVPFLVGSEHEELGDPVVEGYFIAEIRARIPGFD